MAEANSLAFQDQFSCPVCLDLLKDPVSLLCGHSYCMVCINGCWDQEDQKGVYSCPQCRQTFSPRPVVSKNTILAEVMKTLEKTKPQASHPDHCSAGPEDVECDSCTGRKSKAIKSCLVCLASFCETHLQPHYESPAFKKHKLVEASRRLHEQICSEHDKLLEVYCRTDQQCICMLCMLDKHKRHDTISAAAGRAEKQKQLLEVHGKCQQKIQEREQELQKLTKAVETHKCSAQIAVQKSQRIFTELINSIKRRCCEATKLIRDQEQAAVSRAEEVRKQLEQEIAEVKRRDTEMKELSHTEDPIHFLQSFQLLVSPGSADLPDTTVSSLLTFEAVVKSVSQLQEKLEACAKEQFEMMISEVKKVVILPPQSREECLQYSCQLTLDPNTAHQRLQLSDSNRMVTHLGNVFKYDITHDQLKIPKTYEHPESFNHHSQVLCTESVHQPCYWEVEWSGNHGVSIALSYKDISRKGSGNNYIFGCNDKSWNLLCQSSSYSFLHNNQQTNIPIQCRSSKIGVFVDYKAGTLSFYSVSDTMKLLHRVHTTFTQPLYPGFGLNKNSTVKLCY